jgi:hypothetical protein
MSSYRRDNREFRARMAALANERDAVVTVTDPIDPVTIAHKYALHTPQGSRASELVTVAVAMLVTLGLAALIVKSIGLLIVSGLVKILGAL